MLGTVYLNHGMPVDVTLQLLHESIGLWEACITQGADPDEARAKQLRALLNLGTPGQITTSEAELRSWDTTAALIYRGL
jgi:hypothetical protein